MKDEQEPAGILIFIRAVLLELWTYFAYGLGGNSIHLEFGNGSGAPACLDISRADPVRLSIGRISSLEEGTHRTERHGRGSGQPER